MGPLFCVYTWVYKESRSGIHIEGPWYGQQTIRRLNRFRVRASGSPQQQRGYYPEHAPWCLRADSAGSLRILGFHGSCKPSAEVQESSPWLASTSFWTFSFNMD